MELLESCKYFCGYWELLENGTPGFIVASSFDMSPAMYDCSKPKSPLDAKLQIGHIGSSSFVNIATLMTTDGEQLVRNLISFIIVDTNSGRSQPLPDWWKQKYVTKGEGVGPLRFSTYEKPATAKAFRVYVSRSDQGVYNHTNWSCYVRFALDGLHHHVKHGLVSGFPDLEKRGIKRMELSYSGQSFDGDSLDVFVWNDANDVNKVGTHIEKDGKLIFQGIFEYYQHVHASL